MERDSYVQELLGIVPGEDIDSYKNTEKLESLRDSDAEGGRRAPYIAIGMVVGAVLFIPAALLDMKLIGAGLFATSVFVFALLSSSA